MSTMSWDWALAAVFSHKRGDVLPVPRHWAKAYCIRSRGPLELLDLGMVSFIILLVLLHLVWKPARDRPRSEVRLRRPVVASAAVERWRGKGGCQLSTAPTGPATTSPLGPNPESPAGGWYGKRPVSG